MSEQVKRMEAARFGVVEACAVCRRVQRELESVRQLTKDDRSPVTVADFASQAVVARALAEQLGDRVVLVAEEDSAALREQIDAGERTVADAVVDAVHTVWPGATIDDVLAMIDVGGADPPAHGGGFWTLDPIDGTKGFLRGGQYAVSLAWIESGTPVLGVLGCPNLSRDFDRPLDDPDPRGVLYCAVAGDGVYEYAGDDPGAEPVHIRRLEPAPGDPVVMCESVESGHTSHDASGRVLEALGTPGEPVRLDSQAKYAVVARGQADVYLRLPRPGKPYVERIWDHGAGSLVASEAGCFVTDVAGRALDFSHGRGLEKNRGVVVAPPALHGLAIGAIERLGLASV